jgi:hypothetical protein
MAKGLRPKKQAAQKQDSGKTVQKNVHGQVNFILSFSDGHRGQTYEEVVERLKELVAKEWPTTEETRGASFTPTGGHYLIDGKVCRVQDFDPETMDRKPGTFPPSYTVSGEEKKQAILAERAEELAKNPPKNQLGVQPPNLLTSAEAEEVKQSRLRPSPKPKQEEISVPSPKRPVKKLRRG